MVAVVRMEVAARMEAAVHTAAVVHKEAVAHKTAAAVLHNSPLGPAAALRILGEHHNHAEGHHTEAAVEVDHSWVGRRKQPHRPGAAGHTGNQNLVRTGKTGRIETADLKDMAWNS